MRYAGILLMVWLLCVGCAARHQLPQTETQLKGNVISAESAYRDLYSEFKAQRLNKAAMTRVRDDFLGARSLLDYLSLISRLLA